MCSHSVWFPYTFARQGVSHILNIEIGYELVGNQFTSSPLYRQFLSLIHMQFILSDHALILYIYMQTSHLTWSNNQYFNTLPFLSFLNLYNTTYIILRLLRTVFVRWYCILSITIQVIPRGHQTGVVANHTCCTGDTWYIQLDEEDMNKTLGIKLHHTLYL